jgi:16S rRNA (guanine527-N7)-methyltransferase
MNTASLTKKFRETLESEAAAYGVMLAPAALDSLEKYYELLNVWNARVHLVAPCSPQEFATRHILESLLLLKHLPNDGRIAEVGAGAGLPIIPCLLVRLDLRAVLIEASQKKAVFLREALSRIAIANRASVIAERFESVPAPEVGFVTCRALERFEEMLPQLLEWAPPKSMLLLFGGQRLEKGIESLGYTCVAELIPKSKARYLFLVNRP